MSIIWTVYMADKKMTRKIPKDIQHKLIALIKQIEIMGPVRGNWANYSKRGNKDRHHCHLKKKSKPTYVVIWEVVNNSNKIIQITYVGTREKAPY